MKLSDVPSRGYYNVREGCFHISTVKLNQPPDSNKFVLALKCPSKFFIIVIAIIEPSHTDLVACLQVTFLLKALKPVASC